MTLLIIHFRLSFLSKKVMSFCEYRVSKQCVGILQISVWKFCAESFTSNLTYMKLARRRNLFKGVREIVLIFNIFLSDFDGTRQSLLNASVKFSGSPRIPDFLNVSVGSNTIVIV